MNVTYPFTPKSTSYLLPGQFWSIPLENGKYACGRVMQLCIENGKNNSRLFLAGLMDWCDAQPPTENSIRGSKTLAQGEAHIKTILETGKQIIGYRPLEKDNLSPQYFLSGRYRWGCYLMKGYDRIRIATPEDEAEYPVFTTWGFRVIKVRAEHHFGS